jgi:hypothetical protein
MSQGLVEVLAEFFDVFGSQKAHWYRVFDPSNGDETTFSSNPHFYP